MLKKALAVAAVVAALAGFGLMQAHATQLDMNFYENDVGNTLQVSAAGLSGTTVTPDGANQWLVGLGSTSPLLDMTGAILPMGWIATPTATTGDYITLASATSLLFQSDFLVASMAANTCGATPSPLPDGVSCFIGSTTANTYFANVHGNYPAVPAPASWLMLSTGLVVLGGLSRREQARMRRRRRGTPEADGGKPSTGSGVPLARHSGSGPVFG